MSESVCGVPNAGPDKVAGGVLISFAPGGIWASASNRTASCSALALLAATAASRSDGEAPTGEGDNKADGADSLLTLGPDAHPATKRPTPSAPTATLAPIRMPM